MSEKNYEIKCKKCGHISDQVYVDHGQYRHVMSIYMRDGVVSDCEICSKQTVHDLVSFEPVEPKQEPELTDQQKDLIERCNK